MLKKAEGEKIISFYLNMYGTHQMQTLKMPYTPVIIFFFIVYVLS